jgi:hypothetical protein
MATAEQLLRNKQICEVIQVSFPAGTLFTPYEEVTQGELYKMAPIGTPTVAIKKQQGFEYYLAIPLGNVFIEA